MKKRLLSGIICLCLLLAMFPAMASVASAEGNVIASGYCGGEGGDTNLTWTLTDDGTLTISGEGKIGNYTEESPPPWYEHRRSMKTLVIETGVTSIGINAFHGCKWFTGTLVIPDSVTTIDEYAFYNCGGFAGDLVIPASVTSIGAGAFFYCTGFNGDLVMSDGVTSIGDAAFSYCNFTGDLVIPASVTSIGGNAFAPCDGLSNVYFKGNAPTVSSEEWLFCTNDTILALLNASGGGSEDVVNAHPGLTIYYIPGTTGWTDSEYYDAATGTWLGYKLATWDNESIDSSDESISFTDVNANDWFYSYVADMTKAGVVSGYPDGSFRPQGNVTWGEALKLVLKTTGYGEFEAGTHWASGYMTKALAEGFMDHEVDLNSAITRGEMADLTAKAMKLAPSTSPNPFDDEVSSYAVALYEAEIITGSQDNGRLVYRADSTITRAEMAAIISRVYNK